MKTESIDSFLNKFGSKYMVKEYDNLKANQGVVSYFGFTFIFKILFIFNWKLLA